MRILRHYTDVPAQVRGSVVAIGNFDGVHLGHQAVIAEAGRIAAAAGAPHAALTFEPHPRSFFTPRAAAFKLTSLRSKAHQIEALGVEVLFVLTFDAEFAAISAADFVDRVLVQGLGLRHAVVGFDFVFGHRRAGDTRLLSELAPRHRFELTVVEPVGHEGEVYSSSRIRQALKAAEPRLAAELLGHWWVVEGRVGEGERRGRQLGYATANLSLDDFLEPALGIYAVRAGLETESGVEWRDAVASLGRRPTFGGGEVMLEVHLFDFSGDLYGQHLRVAFVDYIREEKKFDDIDGLKAAMAADCEAARRILAATPTEMEVVVAPPSRAPNSPARRRAGT
jgi:riboflavin kinase/FMN adenylyltransferase